MAIPTKVEIDIATKVISEVPLNDAELAQLEADRAAAQAAQAEREEAENAITLLKASAREKLVAGEPLTAEEAALVVL